MAGFEIQRKESLETKQTRKTQAEFSRKKAVFQ